MAKQHFDALFKPNVGAQELVLNLITHHFPFFNIKILIYYCNKNFKIIVIMKRTNSVPYFSVLKNLHPSIINGSYTYSVAENKTTTKLNQIAQK